MIAYVFPSLAAAQAHLPPAVDAFMGYPRPGLDIGGGTHCPAAQSVTQTYFSPIQNPSTLQWAYVYDPNIPGIVGPNAIAWGLSAPVSLDATWFPSGITGATGATVG